MLCSAFRVGRTRNAGKRATVRPAERALFEGVQKLERAGRTVARFPPLKVLPTRNAEQSTVVSEL